MSKLSVIVPVYNVEKYLEKSIDSLINQTYKDLDIIIVNDGSTDNSRNILKKYEHLPNVTIYDKENSGACFARKFALEKVNTEYVTFFDSDDLLDTDTYQIIMQKLLQDKSIDIFMFNHYIYHNNNKDICYRNTENEFTYITNPIKSLLVGDIDSYLWNKIYKTDLFENIDYPNVGSHDDMIVIFNLLLNKCKNFMLWKQPKYHYMVRPNSISTAPSQRSIIGYIEAIMTIDKGIKQSERYNNLLVELEFFKSSRIADLMRLIIKISKYQNPNEIDMSSININMSLLKKAKSLYKISNTLFIMNFLYSLDRKLCYHSVKLVRKIRKSEQKNIM